MEAKEENCAIVLKFIGMGSIIRIASIWENCSVDFEKIVFCTFIQNKEICELLGFKHVIYIRTGKLTYFIADICCAILAIRKHNPNYLLDLERCSAAVGIFRILCGWIASCKTLSFNKQKKDITGRNDHIWSLHKLTYGAALEKVTTFLSKDQTSAEHLCIYQESLVDKNKILVNINTSAYLPQRKFSHTGFVQLIQTLHTNSKDSTYHFYLTGSSDEYSYVQPLVHTLQLQAIDAYNVAGKWNLRELVHQLANCKMFITGDSGPMHLAIYMQIPTIIIWGPTHYRYFGYQNNAHARHISLDKSCSPCFTDPTTKVGHACKGMISCMKELSPNLIATAIDKWMLHHASFYRKWIMPRGLLPVKSMKETF